MSYELLSLIATAVLLLGLLVTWLLRRRNPLQREIKKLTQAISHDALKDLLVPDGMGGEIHVDYLLKTHRGFLLLDVRDVSGVVFAGERMHEWSATLNNQRINFDNPIPSLFDRLAAVKSIASGVPVDAKVVFVNAVTFPKGHPDQVTTVQNLVDDYATHSSSIENTSFDPKWAVFEGLVR
ncbi:MAG: hypothetical protein ACI9ON_002562 [Limisphaerales bacterium]